MDKPPPKAGIVAFNLGGGITCKKNITYVSIAGIKCDTVAMCIAHCATPV